MPGNPNEQTLRRLRQIANQWDRWLRDARRGLPPKQADPRLAAGEVHPSAAEDPHYTMAKAMVRFVRNVPAGPEGGEEAAASPPPRASRGSRQRSQSLRSRGPVPTKARPGPPPASVAWHATAVAGRPPPPPPPPPEPAARPGDRRDRGHTRSPAPKAMPRPRAAAAAGAAADAGRGDRNSARRRHVSWSDMRSSSYESGSDASGPGEATQRRAQPAAAAAGWGHGRGARAQRVDHDRPAQFESPRTRGRALVFANWTPMGAAAPYMEVPPAICRDVAPELRGQYIYAQFPIQDSCLFGARPWQILNQHV